MPLSFKRKKSFFEDDDCFRCPEDMIKDDKLFRKLVEEGRKRSLFGKL